jgi:hypothetical protein
VTEPTRDLGRAFAGLSQEVRERTVPPPAAGLRKRAEHQVRVRRTTTALVAAAAVAAIAVGGASVLRDTAIPVPPQPADSGTPTPRLSAPPSALPSEPDPITEVSWPSARIEVPATKGCPSGRLQFRADPGRNGAAYAPAKYPRLYIDPRRVAYGDLTGDGQAEAVMGALCLDSDEDSGDGRDQLVVVQGDGSDLRVIDWVGPRGAVFTGFWVEGGRLIVEAVTIYDNSVPTRLGQTLAYRWTPKGFVDAPSDYPALLDTGRTKPPQIDLRRVAKRTRCPEAVLRFNRDGHAETADALWDISPGVPTPLPHVVDLDGTGHRWVLVPVTCTPLGANPSRGKEFRAANFLGVLERVTPEEFLAVDAIPTPAGHQIMNWTYDDGKLAVDTAAGNGDALQTSVYHWRNGHFTR